MRERRKDLGKAIQRGVTAAIIEALTRHAKLGDPIAVWQNGRIVTLRGKQILHAVRKHNNGKLPRQPR